MPQMLRIAGLATSFLVWVVLMLLALPALEGGGESSLFQLGITSAFLLWLAWAGAALAYDRRHGPGVTR